MRLETMKTNLLTNNGCRHPFVFFRDKEAAGATVAGGKCGYRGVGKNRAPHMFCHGYTRAFLFFAV
jgi:hypothetical protein